jgi:hypothetical protein
MLLEAHRIQDTQNGSEIWIFRIAFKGTIDTWSFKPGYFGDVGDVEPSGQNIKIASTLSGWSIDETWTRTDMALVAGMGATRQQAHRQGSARPLEDHDLPGGIAP